MATTAHGLWYPEDYNAAADVPLNLKDNTLSIEAALVDMDGDLAAMGSKVDAATAAMQTASPIGSIIAFGSATPPSGWHLCNGTAHGSAALQAVIGSTLTPNLVNRFVVAAGGAYGQGAAGGADSVALAVAHMPAHSHGGATVGDSPDHTHRTMVGWAEDAGNNWEILNGHGVDAVSFNRTAWMDSGGASARHTHGIYAEGGGAAHENRPPYYALTYIIRKA